jgi:Nitroreductase family
VLNWPVSVVRRCDDVVPPVSRSFSSIIQERRSDRAIVRAPLRELVNAVAFATRPQAVMDGDQFCRSRRPSPSAGALHPVDILLVHGRSRVFRYVPLTHRLEGLYVEHREHLDAFTSDCLEILPGARGTAVVLVGDVARVAAVYERPLSLLWRDGGALLQTLALVATAYRLAFCPLGILGTPVLQALGLPEWVSGVGVAIIGRRADA